MSPFSSLTFNIEGVSGEITPDTPLWHEPLAGRSSEFSGMTDPAAEGWTIGAYFMAARAFISRRQVVARLAELLGRETAAPSQWEMSLNLQKHGAFYHPIKMAVFAGGRPGKVTFALNGAVSAHGRELARKEQRLFSQLEQCFSSPITPEAYAAGEVSRSAGQAGFLLARWLEGYYEFHLTETRGIDEIAVWRPGAETVYLSIDRALPAYENIARILTRAYDPATGGQVLFWHHGAGDFIMAPDRDCLPVKLITVREYGSMVDEDLLTQSPMPGLFLFFVNLCLRMQMDRRDGVGSPVFLGQKILAATVRGFFLGLSPGKGDRDKERVNRVWDFFKGFTRDQILLALEQMLAAWPPGPSERELVGAKINDLAGQTRDLFKSGKVSDFY